MSQCFHCGNCQQNGTMYYCTARNEFIIPEKSMVVEKDRTNSGWKKGDPNYEKRRRKVRQERGDLKKIV
ncbi:hypothetical protein [Zhaonella formicivorans]|uniref:hypothetical protein n=1 Tax=Zhaonella formicivorans TaxID=2528593 RepID=UPI0010F3DDCD|nr:hypothetical protein [Zhaonella formicivorans]